MPETRDDLREALSNELNLVLLDGGNSDELAEQFLAGPLAPILAQVSALQAEVERLQKVEGERENGRVTSSPGYSAEPEPVPVSALTGEYPSRKDVMNLRDDLGKLYAFLKVTSEGGRRSAFFDWAEVVYKGWRLTGSLVGDGRATLPDFRLSGEHPESEAQKAPSANAELETENARLRLQLTKSAENFKNTWAALGQANKECEQLRARLEGRQRP